MFTCRNFSAINYFVLLACPVPALAHGGLGSLGVLFYAALFALGVVGLGIVISIPCMLKARQLKRDGRTDDRAFRVLRRTVMLSLLLSSPVFVILFVMPGLAPLAVLAGIVFIAIVVSAVRVFNTDAQSPAGF